MAPTPPKPDNDADPMAELVERLDIDPALIAAAAEVDVTLLRWSLSLSPLERLDACTRATRALAKFKRVPSEPS